MDKEIETDKGKFVDKLKSTFDTTQKDNKDLIGKKIEMSALDYVSMPEKMHAIGHIGETSVKKDGPRHNPLHGGDGKFKE